MGLAEDARGRASRSMAEQGWIDQEQPAPRTWDELDGGAREALRSFFVFAETFLLRRPVPRDVEDQVVALANPAEVLAGWIDHAVGADRSKHVELVATSTAVTSFAPNALAICTAKVPTPTHRPLR
jgi:hypothetical protein